MKKLIHLVLAVLPAATFADEWLEGGRPPAAPPAVVSAGAADNLGDHAATNTLQLGTNVVDFSGMGQLDLYAGLIRGYASGNLTNRLQLQGSPAALVGEWKYDLDATAVDDSAELVNYRTATNLIRTLAGAGSGDDLGNHTATQPLNLQANGITNASDVFLAEGLDSGWTLGAQYGGPAAYYQAEFAGGSPADVVGFYPWNPSDGDVLTYSAANDTWQPAAAAGGGGNTLFGDDASDPASGQDVFIRAGSVRDPFALTGMPGTTFIQGATNGVSAKQGAIVISTTGGNGPDAISGGDITIQSGNGGAMGGSNGVIRIIPGYGDPTDKTPRLLLGNKDAGHYVEFDGAQLTLNSGGCTIRFVAGSGPSDGWMEIAQGSITKLVFTNDTIQIDGAELYTGTPGAGQVPVFTKGFCTGVTTP